MRLISGISLGYFILILIFDLPLYLHAGLFLFGVFGDALFYFFLYFFFCSKQLVNKKCTYRSKLALYISLHSTLLPIASPYAILD